MRTLVGRPGAVLAISVLAGVAAFLPLRSHADASTVAAPQATPRAQQVPIGPNGASEDAPDAAILKMAQDLNRMNPFVHQIPQIANGQAGAATQPGPSEAELGAIKALLENKWVQKYIHVLSDPDLQHDALGLFNNPQRKAFLFWELGWILFMLIFKAWRMMKAKGFFAILYTQLWTMALFLVGVFYFIPSFVLGPGYFQFTHHLIRALHG